MSKVRKILIFLATLSLQGAALASQPQQSSFKRSSLTALRTEQQRLRNDRVARQMQSLPEHAPLLPVATALGITGIPTSLTTTGVLVGHVASAGAATTSLNPYAGSDGSPQGALAVASHHKNTSMQVYHDKPSQAFMRRSGFDSATGLTRHFDDNGPVNARDFYDAKLAQEEPLLMLEGPANDTTSLVRVNEALSPASAVSDAAITNMLIAAQNPQGTELMLHPDALDDNRIKPTLLLLARSSLNNYKAADALIERGARARYSSYTQENPLHLACEQGHDQTVLRLLEECDIDINQRTYRCGLEAPSKKTVIKDGKKYTETTQQSVTLQETPLMIAVKNQHRSCVVLMILAGPQLDRTDQYGLTAQAHADCAYDRELLKVPKGDIVKAKEIIQLFKNHDYIERLLNKSEVQLLKNYFLERYPALALTEFPDEVKVVVCRYLGFQRWDNKALTRAFESTGVVGFLKMRTAEPASDGIVPVPQDSPLQQATSGQLLAPQNPFAVVPWRGGAPSEDDLPAIPQSDDTEMFNLNTVMSIASNAIDQPTPTEIEKLEVIRSALISANMLPPGMQQNTAISAKKGALLIAIQSALLASYDLLQSVRAEGIAALKKRADITLDTPLPPLPVLTFSESKAPKLKLHAQGLAKK